MTIDARISALIKQVYSAGEDTGAWDGVAVDLLQIMGCSAGVASLVELAKMELLGCRVYLPSGAGLGDDKDGYHERYSEDPSLWWASANPHSRFCDSNELFRSGGADTSHPFVRWVYKRLDARRWYVGYSSSSDLAPTFLLSAYFSKTSEEQITASQNVFRTVFDHIDCALRLGRRSPVEGSSRALLRLSADGAVLQQSAGAQLLLQQPGPLRIGNGQVVVHSTHEQLQLSAAINRAFSTRQSAPTAVYLARTSQRPWIAVVRPVEEFFGPFGRVVRECQVELFDRTPGIGRLDLIQSLFALSGRELQVLRFLSEGHSIDSLSACIEVSRNTTRAHLRSIYLKTSTNSQSELMQLCAGLSSAAAMEPSESGFRSKNVN